ncbi:hypothetical protein JXA80_02145 [bacterium]|nr:hypothetical protein [candidate division CSSED10-310 bacterium]
MSPEKPIRRRTLAQDSSWSKLSPSLQAVFKLNVMLAEIELESRNFEKAVSYYLKALKAYFHTDIYKDSVRSIRNLPKTRQHTYLYRLGKCLLIHCQQSGLAQEMFNKLSILDPSFLRPVQKILMMYDDENSSARKQLSVLLAETTRKKSPAPARNHRQPASSQSDIQPDTNLQAELQITLDETGEHFRLQKDLTDSTTIDRETLDGLMDSLLLEEE